MPQDRARLFDRLMMRGSLALTSRELQVSYNALRFWRRGIRPIPGECLNRLASAAGVDLASLRFERVPFLWRGNPVSQPRFQELARRQVELMRAPSARKKALSSVYASHGEEHFKHLALRTAEGLPMTRREVCIEKQNQRLPSGVRAESHRTLCGKNYDFAYFQGESLVATEEVLGWRRKRDQFFFDVAYILARRHVDCPTLLTSWYEQRSNRRTERFPLDLVLWLLEQEGLLPILLDVPEFRQAREDLITRRPVDRLPLRRFCEEKLSSRNLRKGAEAELKTPQSTSERKVHDLFKSAGLRPAGKKAFKTNYGTYLVADDYLPELGTAVFVSTSRVEDLVGASFALKRLCPLPIKAIGIILNPSKARWHVASGVIVGLDALLTPKTIEQWLCSSNTKLCLGR